MTIPSFHKECVPFRNGYICSLVLSDLRWPPQLVDKYRFGNDDCEVSYWTEVISDVQNKLLFEGSMDRKSTKLITVWAVRHNQMVSTRNAKWTNYLKYSWTKQNCWHHRNYFFPKYGWWVFVCVGFSFSPYLIWAAVGGDGSRVSEKIKHENTSNVGSLTAEVRL